MKFGDILFKSFNKERLRKFKGYKCPICDYKFNDIKKIIKKTALYGGKDNPTVCSLCWNQYQEDYLNVKVLNL